MADFNTGFDLADVYDEAGSVSCNLTVTNRGIYISFEGYEDFQGSDTILIENQSGVPHVIVWGDKGDDEPTHTISLEGAKVDLCKKCGSKILNDELCSDITCPYSDRKQNEDYIEG